MFVSLSRASQYEAIISSEEKPSVFFKGLCPKIEVKSGKKIKYKLVPDVIPPHKDTLLPGDDQLINKPVFNGASSKLSMHGVHDFMGNEVSGKGILSRSSSRGREYGLYIHDIALDLFHGKDVDDDSEETVAIQLFLEQKLSEKYLSALAEEPCYLPVVKANVVLHGIIDLLIEYDSHVEIYDYKTGDLPEDSSDYTFQLSVYARAVEGYMRKPVECYLRYVSLDTEVKVEPLTIDEIANHILERGFDSGSCTVRST